MISQCLILPLLALASSAEADSYEAIPDSLSVTLNEVNVTVLKQMNNLFDEAEAATVVSGEELDRLGAYGIKGISDVVPNFFMPDYGSRITSTIYVRGIGARMDQPSVGLNVDNVPYLNKDAYDFDIADIASVEMLRGPQSTLYGRNTMAGVINITTLSPMRFQGWKAMVELANGGRVKGNVGWYHRFNDKTAFSANLTASHQKGFFKNEFNGKYVDPETNYNARMKFIFRPSEEWSLSNTASAGILRQGGYPYEYKETGVISYNDTCFYRRFTFADGLSVSRRGDRFDISSITSVQHINDNMTLDQDFLPEDYFTLTQKKKETSLTEDIVIKGNDADSRYRWLTGLFGFYKHLSMQAPVTFHDRGISSLIESHWNEYNTNYPIGWDSRTFPLNSDFTIPTWGVAAYHESEFQLGDWNLTAGLRLDYERADMRYHSYCSTSYTVYHVVDGGHEVYGSNPVDINDMGKMKRDFITLLPKLSAVYAFPSGIGNMYAKISKGYKAGGFNTQMFSDVLQQRLMGLMGIGAQYDIEDVVSYKPEQSWNYEIGTHLGLCDGSLLLEASLFYIDCRDQQLTMFPDGTTTGRIMTNAGKTRSFGGEISVEWKVTDRLALNGNYGYTNAKFRKFFNGIEDYAGKTLPYAPRNTVFMQGVWTPLVWPRKDARLTLDVNLRGTGDIFWNESNTERQNFYCLLGAGLTLDWGRLNVQLWGRNLTDTRYRTFYFLSMGNEFFQRGRGVEAGVTVRYTI